jgi:type IV pilus assembly protein PilC
MYRRMVRVGAAGNDLPGVLTLLADHYERANLLWTRLKGLLVYPVIVVVVSLVFTAVVSVACSRFLAHLFDQFYVTPPMIGMAIWMPPIVLGLLVAGGIAVATSPKWRGALRWKLPGFREASLAQVASAMSLMLRNGTPLAEALGMAETLESATPAGGQLAEWRKLTEAGQGSPGKWPARQPFPPLFLWLVGNGGSDLPGGFQKAAEIYRGRASYRIEMLLYGALPISILMLGMMLIWQATPLMRSLIWMMNTLGDMGGT